MPAAVSVLLVIFSRNHNVRLIAVLHLTSHPFNPALPFSTLQICFSKSTSVELGPTLRRWIPKSETNKMKKSFRLRDL